MHKYQLLATIVHLTSDKVQNFVGVCKVTWMTLFPSGSKDKQNLTSVFILGQIKDSRNSQLGAVRLSRCNSRLCSNKLFESIK